MQQQPRPNSEVTPLLPSDPIQIGDFWLDGRLFANQAGLAFIAHTTGKAHLTRGQHLPEGQSAIVVQLLDGSATDKAARDRFSGFVNHLHIDDVLARGGHEQDEGRLGRKFLDEGDDPVDPDSQPLAPWVALPYDGTARLTRVAHDLLDTVALTNVPPTGTPAGPDYQLPWARRVWPGLNRVWPLPWPGRYDRAGWVSIFVSWLLMILIAALAVLIAILVFRNASPQPPPPQNPTMSQKGNPQSGSGSPQSASPTPGQGTSPTGTPTATPSQEQSASGSPTPSNSPSPSSSGSPSPASPSPGDTPSVGGRPTPPSRL